MKKFIQLLSVTCICILCVSCDSPSLFAKLDLMPKYVFCIFKFSDPQYKDHIIAQIDTTSIDGKDKIILPSAFPRRDLHKEYYYYENTYLFMDKVHGYAFCDTAGVQQEIDKTNLCDLSNSPRLIELEDGYYMWYPFTSIPVKNNTVISVLWWKDLQTAQTMRDMPVVALSAKWEDICSFDIDTVQIISRNPYSKAIWLRNMYKYTRDMSIDELVETINRLIKEKDFAHGGVESVPWFK